MVNKMRYITEKMNAYLYRKCAIDIIRKLGMLRRVFVLYEGVVINEK